MLDRTSTLFSHVKPGDSFAAMGCAIFSCIATSVLRQPHMAE